MQLIVKGTNSLHGKATPPGSKSHSIRALFLASLCEGTSVLHNVLQSDDTRDAIRVCKQLGAEIIDSGETVIVKGISATATDAHITIDCGNSGLTTHFVLPLLGLQGTPVQVTCGEQMAKRPIDALIHALRNLGMKISSDTLPTKISGQLLGGKTEVSGVTSQYLSALLLALPLAIQDSEITVNNLQERPYVDMTLNYLKQQHIIYSHESYDNTDIYKIQGNQKYQHFTLTIPADFSSASYLITAAVLLPGEVIIQGINMADPQGDKALINLLINMGADITVHENHLHIHGGKPLTGIKIDASDIPDLLPVLAVIGSQASGKTEIQNVRHARIKETDRIHSMTEGLKKMGVTLIEHKDGMTISPSTLKGNTVNGFGDHRTVMALSIAGLLAEGTTTITGSEAIHKTFPNYISLMKSLGANMEANHEIA